ncbi:thiol-disulfide oxidoreductase DCC family protein [Mesonia sp. K7]|uniref:thiol-disulfide oxidoreductase DCC family protein n=1 Tax=Mesonia sp. K7 TaxID=2218606 RepID=UPI000DA74D0D|nr:thiol-disulfide oxidoreductase DCC family protein [Mesonia sp. K7]PZD79189.1 thiol-disulfide oxidoreductase [Mesonia sp. K7]
MTTLPEDKLIILFDGVCNLCNNTVDYVLRKDKKDIFRFASLQSELGQQLLKERGIDPNEVDSIVMIDPGKAYYVKSTAALKIAQQLGGGISFLHNFIFLPESFRNVVYDFVARNRYKWYGKRETCRMPTAEEKTKFLE